MNTIRTAVLSFIALTLLATAAAASAQWELDSKQSSVSFISIKNGAIGESHSFSSVIGFIGEHGNVQLAIDLDSVETQIAVRNDRLREMLFETAKFPAAKIFARIDPEVLKKIVAGGVLTMQLPITLELHDKTQELSVEVLVVGEKGEMDGEGEDSERLRVVSTKPVLINAADFNLVPGIAALQKVAGLQSISTSVPVTLQLVFVPAAKS